MKIKVVNDCALDKVAKVFLPILEEAEKAYFKSISNTKIVNIRLMGSVPRGDARQQHSDIDFVVICNSELSNCEVANIKQCTIELSNKYDQVRKVDLEYENLDQISEGRRFVFITDSISIFGNDIYTKKEYEVDSDDLVKNNTPDLEYLVERYRTGMHEAKNDDEIVQFSRWIGKDILKSFRYRLIVEKNIYEKTAKKIHSQLCNYYPNDKSVFDKLLEAYLDPKHELSELDTILDEVERIKDMYTRRESA